MENPVSGTLRRAIGRADGSRHQLVPSPQSSAHALAALQCLAHFVVVGERQHLVADELPGLVTLAGDDEDIAGAEHADTGGDRLGPVADLLRARAQR